MIAAALEALVFCVALVTLPLAFALALTALMVLGALVAAFEWLFDWH